MYRSLIKIPRSVSGSLGRLRARTISPSWGTSRSIAGSSKCLQLHDKNDYGDDLAILKAKSKTGLLHQKTKNEELLPELTPKAASVDSVVKAAGENQQENLMQLRQAKNDVLKQNVGYKQLLSELKAKVNEFEASSDKQHTNLRFLEINNDNLLHQKAEYEKYFSELKLKQKADYETFYSKQKAKYEKLLLEFKFMIVAWIVMSFITWITWVTSIISRYNGL